MVTVEGIVMPAVLEFLLDAMADLEIKIRCHCYITPVKQATDVADATTIRSVPTWVPPSP
jgi:hypothetical protein